LPNSGFNIFSLLLEPHIPDTSQETCKNKYAHGSDYDNHGSRCLFYDHNLLLLFAFAVDGDLIGELLLLSLLLS